jgi:hypothetical protein
VKRPSTITIRALMTTFVALLTSSVVAGQGFELDWRSPDTLSRAQPPIPAVDVQLVLDDDMAEADFGVNTVSARQFLWFNRFTPPGTSIRLDQIWVLFPSGASSNVSVGDQIELVVYFDPDGDPTTGANLVRSIPETVQVADGNTFSIYTLDPPIVAFNQGDILIGVVNRWVESGVTAATRPAALDVSASQGRSWVGVWTGDPPQPPVLPADSLFSTIDSFQPGNWMIRAFGEQIPEPGIPTASRLGLLVMLLAVGAGGAYVLRSVHRG